MASPNIEDIYSLMGFALSYIQSVERSINFVTTFVLQDGEVLDLDKLNSINKKENKKALGYFIGKVKERVEILPALEELMADFLKNRNDFIHNQDKILGWDLNTTEGINIARNFVVILIRQGHKLNEIFAVLVSSWQEQTDIYPPAPQIYDDYIQEINNKYGSYIDIFFTEKS